MEQGEVAREKEKESEREEYRRAETPGSYGGGFRCEGLVRDRWKVLRDEGGGCQGNALPASAYFSSARALGSIQHHREFPDQTHPLDTQPPPLATHHPFVHPAPTLPFLPRPSFSTTILLFLSCLVSRLPSGPLPLRPTRSLSLSLSLSLLLYPLSPSRSLFLSRLFAECIRASPLSGVVTRPLSLSLSIPPATPLLSGAGFRYSDRKNYRAVFGGSSSKTIAGLASAAGRG